MITKFGTYKAQQGEVSPSTSPCFFWQPQRGRAGCLLPVWTEYRPWGRVEWGSLVQFHPKQADNQTTSSWEEPQVADQRVKEGSGNPGNVRSMRKLIWKVYEARRDKATGEVGENYQPWNLRVTSYHNSATNEEIT
jgi:hypothetical protein